MKLVARLFAVIALIAVATPLRAATAHADGTAGPGPLVGAAWVAERSNLASVVVLDARSNWRAYSRSHIPGAVFTHYIADHWRARRGNVVGMLAPVPYLENMIGALGISNDDHVVVVAPGNNATDMGIATRIYWTFKVLGHDKVSVLNGGMRGYLAASLPLSRNLPTSGPRTFKARFRRELLATQDDVRKALASGGRLIDNRPPPQFIGKQKSQAAKRFGTIPSATNAPAIAMTPKDSGFFRRNAAMAELFNAAGTTTEDDTITFCNTGHWASVGWFVQSELMGKKNVRLYDGSIAEWSIDTANPMVRSAK